MKKHIQKKFLQELTLPQGTVKTIESSGLGFAPDDFNKVKTIPKGMVAFITTEDDKIFRAFTCKIGNESRLIPEPDPILVYFNAAYLNYIQIKEKRDEIFNKLTETQLSEPMINELYAFFGTTSSFIILLFTAIEALINRCIPADFVYKREGDWKTEIFTKKQIELSLSFDEKLKKVLPDATKKSFSNAHPKKYTHISNLKEFRNMIVHTREAEGETTYDYVYKKALTFKYDETLDVVRDFCNFYTTPDFIVECSCSKEF